MDLDLKVDKVIEVIDLVKRLSWGAVPLWFALTLPVIYLAYSKLLPERGAEGTGGRGNNKIVLYGSLVLFVAGTITLLIDQNQKEKIRNNGLRLKQYFISKNTYALAKNSLTEGQYRLKNISTDDIDHVMKLYPSEFMEVQEGTVVLRDSAIILNILNNSERLLDNYLSNPSVPQTQNIDDLFSQSNFFTREVVYKLIIDLPQKYTFTLSNNRPSIQRK